MATRKEVAWKSIDDGEIVYNLTASESNDSFLRAARLLRAADRGVKKAKEELEELDRSPMFFF